MGAEADVPRVLVPADTKPSLPNVKPLIPGGSGGITSKKTEWNTYKIGPRVAADAAAAATAGVLVAPIITMIDKSVLFLSVQIGWIIDESQY